MVTGGRANVACLRGWVLLAAQTHPEFYSHLGHDLTDLRVVNEKIQGPCPDWWEEICSGPAWWQRWWNWRHIHRNHSGKRQWRRWARRNVV